MKFSVSEPSSSKFNIFAVFATPALTAVVAIPAVAANPTITSAGRLSGNTESGIVPNLSSLASKSVISLPIPENLVAVSNPELGLNVKF